MTRPGVILPGSLVIVVGQDHRRSSRTSHFHPIRQPLAHPPALVLVRTQVRRETNRAVPVKVLSRVRHIGVLVRDCPVRLKTALFQATILNNFRAVSVFMPCIARSCGIVSSFGIGIQPVAMLGNRARWIGGAFTTWERTVCPV